MKSLKFQETYLEDLQKKVSLFIVFSLASLLLLIGIADVIFGLNPPLFQIIRFLSSIPFWLGFLLLRKYGHFRLGLIILYVYGLILATLSYKFNDGLDGPVLFTLSIFLAFTSTVFNGWLKWLMLVITFVVFSSLFLFEINGWLVVASNQPGNNHYFLESFIVMCLSGLFSFYAIHYWVNKYREKNTLLLSLQAEKGRAFEELEELNTKKNQLIALLSHDLKNPIGMLGQTLDLVDKDAFEEGELELILKNLRNQSYHLSGMLNNTLNWVLAELQDKDLETQEVSLHRFTNEMKEGMMGQALVKKQTITSSEIGKDQTLEIEASEIRIILKNLLDNAIKFTPVGGKIEFDIASSAEQITWTIRNEGKPIPQYELETLFDFKVKTTFGTLREKGTGIGLPLCKKIADKLNMDLGFTRMDDERNSFHLTKSLN